MSRIRYAGALAAVAAMTVGFAVGDALATPHASAATTAERSTRATESDWSWQLAPGQTLEIEGVAGWVRASAATDGGVRVHARKHAKRSDPAEVSIEEIRTDQGVTLCVRYPDVPGQDRNRCEPGGHSRMSTRNNDVEVDFTVRVPAGVRLAMHAVNGSLDARGLDSEVEAKTVNGSVWVETRRAAEASTVNGSVHARVGELGKGPLAYGTVNGGITLELPPGAGAEISARTVNGALQSDFPLATRPSGVVGREMSGTIGAGGPRVSLRAVNGPIAVRRVAARGGGSF